MQDSGAHRPAADPAPAAAGAGTTALAVYGAIAVGLALAIGADTTAAALAIAAAAVVELTVFYLAHVYADTVGQRYERPGAGWSGPLRYACRHDVALLLGGVPVLGVFLLAAAFRRSVDGSATVALVALVVLLSGYGWLAARRGAAPPRAALAQAGLTALLGVAVLALKLLLK